VVKGYNGTKGNEEADRMAGKIVWLGAWMQYQHRLVLRLGTRRDVEIAMPAGIKQRFRIYPKAPAHINWAPAALKGLVYMVTDKGPQQQWLWEIGKSEKPCCVCDGWTAQNAAHLMSCPWVGDGKGRKSEMIWEDERWCEAVARFIM